MTEPRIKSRLFKAFDPASRGNEDFTRDFASLSLFWGDHAKRKVLKEKMPQVLLARTNIEEKHAIENMAEALSELVTDTRNAASCVSFFCRHFSSRDGRHDDPPVLTNDLCALKLIDESQVTEIEELLKWVKEVLLPRAEPVLRRRGAASGVFPSLKGVSHEAELRAIQLDKYIGPADVERYVPTITGLVGVASIEIRTTGDGSLCFQADTEDLRYLINHLTAAVKDLETLESRYGKRDTD
ncbi:MAG: hypothetical protein ABIF09_18185 [Gemmatimonadota bacterium]